jgi:hypothetical protein
MTVLPDASVASILLAPPVVLKLAASTALLLDVMAVLD